MVEPAGSLLAAELAGILRSCVQCGLCLPTCATWLATGNEVHSPRGRLILLQEVLAGTDPLTRNQALRSFDQCIGCRACETACPSGVPFSLLQHGIDLAAASADGPAGLAPEPAVPGAVLGLLDSVSWLRRLGRAGDGMRALLGALAGPFWRRRLAGAHWGLGGVVRLLGSLPRAPRGDADLVALLDGLAAGRNAAGFPPGIDPTPEAAVPGLDAVTVSFFAGCANAGLMPASSRRFLTLLRLGGCRVEAPPDQVCCGALAAHTGRPERAARLQSINRRSFAPRPAAAGRQGWIVVEASGCGAALKDRSSGLAGEVLDATEALCRLGLPARRAVPLKVVFHDPCHLRHGQGIRQEPRRLLRQVPGLELLEPAEAEVCCGSGGAWGLRYPALSEALGRRKAANLVATGADLIVTTNPGCLGQIADALALQSPALPILPLTDLLWYACRP